MLKQNRRLARSDDADHQHSLDVFHETLEAIALGAVTPEVHRFFVTSYVRGASRSQSTVALEGPTACVTKRRCRDSWNRAVLKRSAREHKRSMAVKAVFIARGSENQFLRDTGAAEICRTVRSQAPTTLHLAGHWLGDPPAPGQKMPHCMRVMLVANLDVPNGFANGTIGRAVHWGPEVDQDIKRRARHSVAANVPDVQVRFYKETAFHSNKTHFLPEVDFVDVVPRKESVPGARGKPLMMQLQLLPSYALTIHKVQALTIRDQVLGCLEGTFAHGQIYVLVSRVVDPVLFVAVGLPPEDLLDEVAQAWAAAGWDVNEALTCAAGVTAEWTYTPLHLGKIRV